jgi:hypothetical protein
MPNIKPRIYFNVIPATQIPRITPRIQILGISGTQIPRIMPRIHGIPGTQIPRIPRIIQPIRLIQNFFFILDGKLNLTFKDNGNK